MGAWPQLGSRFAPSPLAAAGPAGRAAPHPDGRQRQHCGTHAAGPVQSVDPVRGRPLHAAHLCSLLAPQPAGGGAGPTPVTCSCSHTHSPAEQPHTGWPCALRGRSFGYVTGTWHRDELRALRAGRWQANHSVPDAHPFKPLRRYPVRQDAFHTLMLVLYGRLRARQAGSSSAVGLEPGRVEET